MVRTLNVIEAESHEYKNPTDSRIIASSKQGKKLCCRACSRLLELSKECISLIVNKIRNSDKSIFSAYIPHSVSDAFNFS